MSRIYYRLHGKLNFFPVDEVSYFRADSKYVVAYLKDGTDRLIEYTLASLSHDNQGCFLMINRGSLIRMTDAQKLKPHAVVMRDGKELTISRSRLAVARSLLCHLPAPRRQLGKTATAARISTKASAKPTNEIGGNDDTNQLQRNNSTAPTGSTGA